MHLKYAEMLTIVVHENMKLGDNTPVHKTANKSASIHTNQILLSSNGLEFSR